MSDGHSTGPRVLTVAPGVSVGLTYRQAPPIPAEAIAASVTLRVHDVQRWWLVPALGTMWTDGTEVVVDPATDDIDEDLVELMLTGPVAAEAIWGAGGLPIRGAAALTRRGRSVLLFGAPAVGTSTLARTLVLRGGAWLGDELLAVVPPNGPGDRATISGQRGRVLLARDSCSRLGITADQRTTARRDTSLLTSEVTPWRGNRPTPLDWIVRMEASTAAAEASWQRKRGADAIARFLTSMAAATAGTAARNATGLAAEQFRRLCAVADSVRRLEFTRPARDEVRINADARTLEAALR